MQSAARDKESSSASLCRVRQLEQWLDVVQDKLISLVAAERLATTHLARTLEVAEWAEVALGDSRRLARLCQMSASQSTKFGSLLNPRYHLQPHSQDRGEQYSEDQQKSRVALARQAARLARRQLIAVRSSSRRLLPALVDIDFTDCRARLSEKEAELEKVLAWAEKVLDVCTLFAEEGV